MTTRVVVAGLGNPFRRDDGVGPAVVAALRSSAPPGVELVDGPNDPAGLIELWRGVRLCVVVDAVVTGSAPGTVHRIELRDGEPAPAAADRHSTHALAIGEAVALGRALDRLPQRLVLVGVESADIGEGGGLSGPVAAAVPAAADAVLDEVSRDRKRAG